MKIVGRICRPSVLAAVFGAYFGAVMLLAWTFSSTLRTPGFGPDLTRWVYMTHILASAVFLTGLAVLAFHMQNVFETRIREINRQLGIIVWSGVTPSEDVETPPSADLGEADTEEDEGPTERDLDEMLEVLGEAQSGSELGREIPPTPSRTGAIEDEEVVAEDITIRRELIHWRTGLRLHRDFLTRFLLGPALVAVAIIGTSMAMLPGSDGMLQSYFQLNTALILGFAYGWIGLAAYFAASFLGIVASLRTERKQLIPVSARGDSASQREPRPLRGQRIH